MYGFIDIVGKFILQGVDIASKKISTRQTASGLPDSYGTSKMIQFEEAACGSSIVVANRSKHASSAEGPRHPPSEGTFSRIPAELLSLIFETHVRITLNSNQKRRVVGKYSWLRVTEVCRRWRDVAHDTSRIWAEILVVPGRRIPLDIILARSKNAPLQIAIRESIRKSRLRPKAFCSLYDCSFLKCVV